MTTISSGCEGKRQHSGPRGGTGSYSGGRVSTAATLAGLFLLLLGGCGAAKPPKYYQLTVPGEGAPALATATLPVSIVVAPLVAPDLYRDDRLVYGIGAQEMGTYEHQRWVAPPPQMIQQVMLRELRASDRYQSVYSPESSVRGDYTLRGHLYDFKELDSGSSLVARVTMDLELRDYKSGAIVWKHYYTHDEPVSAKTVPAVVAALNQNVQLAVGQVTSGLDEYFAAHPVK